MTLISLKDSPNVQTKTPSFSFAKHDYLSAFNLTRPIGSLKIDKIIDASLLKKKY